jgi:hypothetical protein
MSYREELLEKTKAELTAIAIEYDLTTRNKNKSEIVDDIIRFETGVPEETVIEKVVVKEPVKEDGPLHLVKFIGLNTTFQVGKFTFGVDHPFLAVPERIANHVFKTWPKLFRPATPKEVQEYYG